MRENKVGLSTRKLAISAMFCGLGVVFLYIGSVIEMASLTLVALTSFFVFFAVIEMGGAYPYLIYSVMSVLSLLLLPDKFIAAVYLLFGGIYPILKEMFERLHWVIAWILKLSYFNTVLSILVLISRYLIHAEDSDMGFTFLTYLLGNAVFILYDIVSTQLLTLYLVKLRSRFRVQKYFEK